MNSGLVVIDVDPKNGGSESLAKLVRENDNLPDTVIALTGGGGEHFYFMHPGYEVPCSAVTLGPGLDVRGDGGYVISPPSMHVSGVIYEWDVVYIVEELELSPLPEWLGKLVKSANVHTPETSDHHGSIYEGRRNTSLFAMAGVMRRAGMFENEIFKALLEVNRTRCLPPLDDIEVGAIANGVCRYRPAITHHSSESITLPTILVSDRHMRDISADSVQALIASNRDGPSLFVRGGALVEIVRSGEDVNVSPLVHADLKGILDRVADYVKENRLGITAARPPDDVVKDVLSTPFPGFLNYVVSSCVLRQFQLTDLSCETDTTSRPESTFKPITGKILHWICQNMKLALY